MFLPLPEGYRWLSSKLETHHLLPTAKAGTELAPGGHYLANSHSVMWGSENVLISFTDKAFQRLL